MVAFFRWSRIGAAVRLRFDKVRRPGDSDPSPENRATTVDRIV
jgi:hypothetical protein